MKLQKRKISINIFNFFQFLILSNNANLALIEFKYKPSISY